MLANAVPKFLVSTTAFKVMFYCSAFNLLLTLFECIAQRNDGYCCF
jgi:hypothetical protein